MDDSMLLEKDTVVNKLYIFIYTLLNVPTIDSL